MINSLYPEFQRWSERGSVWIISDTHFDNPDTAVIDPSWLPPEEHVKIITAYVHAGDTLIHLGDVGEPAYMDQIRAHKVLIMGNHDQSIRRFEPFFDEIYAGPLFIGKKILLSHEPVMWLPWCVNIHGHDRSGRCDDLTHVNLCANLVDFLPFNLGWFIKGGGIADVKDIHRYTIDLRDDDAEGYQE